MAEVLDVRGPEAVRLIVRLYSPAPEPGRMPPDALAGRRLLRASSDLPHDCFPVAGSLCICHWLLEHRTVSRWVPGLHGDVQPRPSRRGPPTTRAGLSSASTSLVTPAWDTGLGGSMVEPRDVALSPSSMLSSL